MTCTHSTRVDRDRHRCSQCAGIVVECRRVATIDPLHGDVLDELSDVMHVDTNDHRSVSHYMRAQRAPQVPDKERRP